MRQARCDKRILLNGSTRGCRLLLSLSDICKDTKAYLIRDNANLLISFKQDGIDLKHVYNDHVNTDMSYGFLRIMSQLLATKVRIPSD